MRAELQIAAESGVISYNALKRKWELKDKDSGKTVPIAPVRPIENEMEALMSWLKNVDTDDTYNKIVEMTSGKIQEKKKPKESEDAERTRLLEVENENLRLQLELAKKAENPIEESAPQKPKTKQKAKP